VYTKTADRMSEVDQSDQSNGMMKDAEDTSRTVDDGLKDDNIDMEDGIGQSDQSNGAEDDTNDGGMSMRTRKASERDEVGDDEEEDNRGDKKEDKESSRGGAEAGDVSIRNHSGREFI
jgi:hypothetical protein